MEEIIIQKVDKNFIVCVLEEGKFVEKYKFSEEKSTTLENIYIGTITDILEGMQACFVDIGMQKRAFLPFKDMLPKIDITKENDDIVANAEIKQLAKVGKNVLVQVRKEAFENKGARVSTHITLAGKYLVLMPNTSIITISQKIEDNGERERLIKIIKEINSPGYGYIVRTEALNKSFEEIYLDYCELIKKWENIANKYEELNKNQSGKLTSEEKLLYSDNEFTSKLARDMVRKTTNRIYINDEKIYNQLKEKVKNDILDFQADKDFIREFGMQTAFEKIEDRKIWLKNGAQIVIDKTEALTAIDVNSSHCTGKEILEETVFKVNKEAAYEIMRQIRLKDIGGIIIIDFIDMKKREYKDEILRLMKEEAKKDRSKVDIKDFTQLNLVEMTRRKLS